MNSLGGRWLWPAVLGVGVLGAGVLTGWPLPQRIGLVLIGLLIACLLATQASAWALSASGAPLQPTATAGDDLIVRYEVWNRAPWPVIWTLLHPQGIADYAARPSLVAMPPRGRRQIDLALTCPARGRWPAGGWRLRTGDPFGFFARARNGRASETVLVYPRPLALPQLVLPLPAGRSAHTRGRSGPQSSAMAREVRPYQPGDVLSRIHWLSTARRGALMVREPEGEPAALTWLAVDLDAAVYQGEQAEETVELVIAVTAHLVDRQEQVGIPTALLLAGPDVLVPAGRQRGNWHALREALAMAAPAPGDAEGSLDRLPGSVRWGTLIVITPWADARWSAPMATLARAGGMVICLLLATPESDNDTALAGQAAALDTAGVRVYRYRGWAP